MKIICKKDCSVKKTMQFLTEYIEKMSLEYPVFAEDMEIKISLKGKNGEICPENDKTVCLGQKEMKQIRNMDENTDYYHTDALTGLYNRIKYERDISMFQAMGYERLTCIYIDAVGLHEINNHLGHQAGDDMLCCIADGLRKHFPDSLIYRIGGDEFVVFSAGDGQENVEQKVLDLKQEIRKLDYEISAGIAESTDKKTLNDVINYAENAMRYDKADFYRNSGGLRQMRSLNYKLEKLLLEKQDANHFLNVIAPRYKGVYMVNTEKDTCRYIYVPPYFQQMLDKHKGIFSLLMKEYCRTLVRPEYHAQMEQFFDYAYVEKRLDAGENVDFIYQKYDGSWVELEITRYDQNHAGNQEMLWMFLDKNIQE